MLMSAGYSAQELKEEEALAAEKGGYEDRNLDL